MMTMIIATTPPHTHTQNNATTEITKRFSSPGIEEEKKIENVEVRVWSLCYGGTQVKYWSGFMSPLATGFRDTH